MNPNPLPRAEELLAPWSPQTTAPDRLTVQLGPMELLPAVMALYASDWGYLAAITGLDPGAGDVLHVLYHFAEGPAVVTLRVVIPVAEPVVPTLRDLIPLAAMYEQELTEVLGVTIAGAPVSGRLFLPDDWPEGVYPLRKTFQPAMLDREGELS